MTDITTTATAGIVVNSRGEVISIHRDRMAADRIAERIGAEGRTHTVFPDDTVAFNFHGHPRVGRVTVADGQKVTVRFEQGSTGVIERTIAVDKITRFVTPRAGA